MICKEAYEILSENIGKVVLGKQDVIKNFLCSFFAGGHVLLEDVPGTGKTLLIRSLAASIDGAYKRVQFTPDLLPSDITGIYYYQNQTSNFILRKGAIFSNFFLADEINRATPRTQSALLECMEENSVTIDGETLMLPEPFMVMATMNPIEFQGTFPLPEAQVERFMMKLHMGYPNEDSELEIIDNMCSGVGIASIKKVISLDDVIQAKKEVANVHVSDAVKKYIINLIRATRDNEKVKLGVSPRGVVAMTRAVQSMAAINGRDYSLPDDVKSIAIPVLAHRLILRSQNNVRLSQSGETLIEYLLSTTKIPMD